MKTQNSLQKLFTRMKQLFYQPVGLQVFKETLQIENR